MNDPIFRFTRHMRQRYYERVAQLEWKGQSLIDCEIKKSFHESVEDKSWPNKTNFVDYVKKRYGNCKIKIHRNHNGYIFLSKRHDSISNLYFVVTVFYPNTSYYEI